MKNGHQLLNKTTIAAIITKGNPDEIALIENIQREELNPLEEADAYTTLIEKFNLSQEDISLRVGKDRSTVANTIRLLKLPARAQKALIERSNNRRD